TERKAIHVRARRRSPFPRTHARTRGRASRATHVARPAAGVESSWNVPNDRRTQTRRDTHRQSLPHPRCQREHAGIRRGRRTFPRLTRFARPLIPPELFGAAAPLHFELERAAVRAAAAKVE